MYVDAAEALRDVREALLDEIDGATETVGRDTRLTEMVRLCDAVLGDR